MAYSTISSSRTLPELTPKQAASQAARLAQAAPTLAAAYAEALRRWLLDPALRLAGRPIVTECFRSVERQNELYAQGRTRPGAIVTYKRGGESKHNLGPPTPALDVAFLLADGSVSWSGLLLSKFARLMKAADARVVWGGDWNGNGRSDDERWLDRPHFELLTAPKGGPGHG
ncbi:M15 family metallopeptidase [Hymenobacter latericus]|uniref:M15 family metallopeptidase n=1 Tax=Hymenobacter sp. YIM 151858-1 TaxID=2987688 RepID=UPI0022265880|nr:M15 family metallopeptidase [Hymenobacter sp. YIM 151858-1]UYZ60203.1 M15 family metallopeptidase [Hymenobacter sp. YIM 151858-1]